MGIQTAVLFLDYDGGLQKHMEMSFFIGVSLKSISPARWTKDLVGILQLPSNFQNQPGLSILAVRIPR